MSTDEKTCESCCGANCDECDLVKKSHRTEQMLKGAVIYLSTSTPKEILSILGEVYDAGYKDGAETS